MVVGSVRPVLLAFLCAILDEFAGCDDERDVFLLNHVPEVADRLFDWTLCSYEMVLAER